MTFKIRKILKNLINRATPQQKIKLHFKVEDEECISNLFDVLVNETSNILHPEIAPKLIDFLRKFELGSGPLSDLEYEILSVCI